MNYHELLEKYFRAETTLDEEARLRSYILSDEVADDLRQYRPLFQFFEEEKEHSLSEGFEEKLLAEMQQPAKLPSKEHLEHYRFLLLPMQMQLL